jgi:hypothetical protein
MQRIPFLSKLMHNFYREKNGQNIWASCVIFNKLSKVKNDPISENSPNLITLFAGPCERKESYEGFKNFSKKFFNNLQWF